MIDNCGQILNVLNEYMTLRMVVIMWLDRLLEERFVPFQHQRTKEPWLDPISSLRSPKRMAARSQRSCTNATTAVQTVTTAMMALDFIIADPERTECKKCKTKCLHDGSGHKSSQICLMLLEIEKNQHHHHKTSFQGSENIMFCLSESSLHIFDQTSITSMETLVKVRQNQERPQERKLCIGRSHRMSQVSILDINRDSVVDGSSCNPALPLDPHLHLTLPDLSRVNVHD